MQRSYLFISMGLMLLGSVAGCSASRVNHSETMPPKSEIALSKSKPIKATLTSAAQSKVSGFDLPADIAEGASTSSPDPFERYNRVAFGFNQAVDKVVLRPVATIYKHVLPWPVRLGVSHFFSNIAELPSFAGHVLRGESRWAGTTVVRFAVNSTVGLLGVLDVATPMGVAERKQDIGSALAKWGDKQSPYLVLPILGPSTLRDTFALPLDYIVGVYPHISPIRLRYQLIGLNIVRFRSELLDSEQAMNTASMDRYAFERDAYLQLRHHVINANANEVLLVNKDLPHDTSR